MWKNRAQMEDKQHKKLRKSTKNKRNKKEKKKQNYNKIRIGTRTDDNTIQFHIQIFTMPRQQSVR